MNSCVIWIELLSLNEACHNPRHLFREDLEKLSKDFFWVVFPGLSYFVEYLAHLPLLVSLVSSGMKAHPAPISSAPSFTFISHFSVTPAWKQPAASYFLLLSTKQTLFSFMH